MQESPGRAWLSPGEARFAVSIQQICPFFQHPPSPLEDLDGALDVVHEAGELREDAIAGNTMDQQQIQSFGRALSSKGRLDDMQFGLLRTDRLPIAPPPARHGSDHPSKHQGLKFVWRYLEFTGYRTPRDPVVV